MEPFYCVESLRNRQSGGAGPGLTIASDVVRRHGGGRLALRNAAGVVWWQQPFFRALRREFNGFQRVSVSSPHFSNRGRITPSMSTCSSNMAAGRTHSPRWP